jgi:hypothetical protein
MHWFLLPFSASRRVCRILVATWQALVTDLIIVFTAERGHQSSPAFRRFRKRLYHAQLEAIFEPLRPFMKQPDLTRFPDGHYRRAIYEIGPFIADYPEQVLLTSVVQGWCPK